MSIKDQLRAAILSGGATGASPSGEAVSINCKGTVGEWETISTFVAPANGYAQIQGKSTDVGGMATLTSTSGYAGMNWAAMGLHFGFSLPVKKGETVTCQGARLANITVQMLKLVGGGKSPVAQLFWRVVPCLRTCLTRALTPIADRIRVSSQGAILQLTSRSRQGMRMLTQTLTFLRATACSLFSVSPLKATPTTTSRFDEISSTVGSLGATGRRGRFLRLLAERAKRFTGTRGLMELLRTSRRTSAFTHTSALNVCFGGASYE